MAEDMIRDLSKEAENAGVTGEVYEPVADIAENVVEEAGEMMAESVETATDLGDVAGTGEDFATELSWDCRRLYRRAVLYD